MKTNKPTCGAGFVSRDGAESYTCQRPDSPHVRHRDGNAEFLRLPGGALITKPAKPGK
ncbi:hypothetical protein [Streptosporangium saharense]|uniref:Uncharacterized protein n=1 Tax=Streptosporangium saharense TaxID=1706840 RepID=A0A7W7VP84_9ACTN|nr:hypothetical protein [Streptosporangium saharense]MBB4917413.1 hypothetical protein [Streptosporangium saharense]